MCIHVHTYATAHIWRSGDNLQELFSLSTMWVMGIQLRSSGLAATPESPCSNCILKILECISPTQAFPQPGYVYPLTNSTPSLKCLLGISNWRHSKRILSFPKHPHLLVFPGDQSIHLSSWSPNPRKSNMPLLLHFLHLLAKATINKIYPEFDHSTPSLLPYYLIQARIIFCLDYVNSFLTVLASVLVFFQLFSILQHVII